MADIDLEKKKKGSMAWLWLVLLGLVAAAVIAWMAMDDDEAETAVVDQPTQAAEPQPAEPSRAAEGAVPVSAILADTSEWTGRTVSGTVAVGSVPTDRGFWIEDQGQRLFVVLDPHDAETPYEVEAENRVDIQSATVRDASYVTQVTGELDEETRNIIQDQQVFLVADGREVDLLAAR